MARVMTFNWGRHPKTCSITDSICGSVEHVRATLGPWSETMLPAQMTVKCELVQYSLNKNITLHFLYTSTSLNRSTVTVV